MSLRVKRAERRLMAAFLLACVWLFCWGFAIGWRVRDVRADRALDACSRQTSAALKRAERAERLATSVADRANYVIEAWPEFVQPPDDAGEIYLNGAAIMRLLEEQDVGGEVEEVVLDVGTSLDASFEPMTVRGPQ